MIHAIELENFKGIAARQRIELAPVTLLFGANSAGKSAILQSLLYTLEVLDRGSPDVDVLCNGTYPTRLGGFDRIVHQHDLARQVVVRVAFETPGVLNLFGRAELEVSLPDLEDELTNAWVELRAAWRNRQQGGPALHEVAIGVEGEPAPLVTLHLDKPEATTSQWQGASLLYATLNVDHPFLAAQCNARGFMPFAAWANWAERSVDDRALTFALVRDANRRSAVPDPARPLTVAAMVDPPYPENEPEEPLLPVQNIARAILEVLVLGPLAELQRCLRDALYVGPIRTVPSGVIDSFVPRKGLLWADGAAAWDALAFDDRLLSATNDWLAKLGGGFSLVVRGLRSMEEDGTPCTYAGRSVRILSADGHEALPAEVGMGVSQLVPALVASLLPGIRLVVLEQPELHVHPALQVGLGDVLIEAATRSGKPRMLLVETHSEHVILRLLRRIRETTEGTRTGWPAFSESSLSVLHVENAADGVRVRRLRVDDQGEFVDRWPKGFFAERMEELL